jgi:hypothetical protein
MYVREYLGQNFEELSFEERLKVAESFSRLQLEGE